MVKLLNKLDDISQDKKVIIDFFADWCGPCKRIAPQYIELSKKYPNIEFCKCDVDANSDLSENFNVNALPTFILLLNGKIFKQLEGADIEGLKNMIKDLNEAESSKPEDTKEICVESSTKEECVENSTKEECVENTTKEECVENSTKEECVENSTKEECVETTTKECCVNKSDCTKEECAVTKNDCCLNKSYCSKVSCECND
jgi:thioredoxin 1